MKVDENSLRTAWLPGAFAAALMLLLSLGEGKSLGALLGRAVFVGVAIGVASYFSNRKRPKSEADH
jgi:hypothetical protein